MGMSYNPPLTATNVATAIEITNPTVISNITNESNWSLSGYTGSTTGLTSFMTYYDSVNKIRYTYQNGALLRDPVNDFTL